MFNLAKLNFMDVERLSNSAQSVIVVPIGSVEEHGPHLPLALDTFAAEVYAKEIAPHREEQGFEVILAPSIYYGVAQQALGFPGTLTIKPVSLRHCSSMSVRRFQAMGSNVW